MVQYIGAGSRDIEAHLVWRLGRFAREAPRWPEALAGGRAGAGGAAPLSDWVSALDLRGAEPAFLPLNSYDRTVPWTGEAFEPRPRGPRTIRPAWFGNEFRRLGARAPFLMNHCDAQGWDYPARWPALAQVPVFQYCRLPAQRDQVALVALDAAYAGPGSAAVPLAGYDPVPFRAKIPRLVWRGRCSGTRQHPDRIDWAEGIFRRILADPDPQTSHEEDIAALLAFPRPAAVAALAGREWADAGLVTTPADRRALAGRLLPQALRPLVRAPLVRERQLKSRYILCIDGNDVPSGVYWALLSGSLVFRMSEGWETVLDIGLRPWEHFVPVAPDGSDLEAAFLRCEADPDMCEEIVANAHRALGWAADAELRERIDRAVLDRYASLVVAEGG